MRLRVVRIVDDERAAQAVAILCLVVRVIPERARLVRNGEFVIVRMSYTQTVSFGSVGPNCVSALTWDDGAL